MLFNNAKASRARAEAIATKEEALSPEERAHLAKEYVKTLRPIASPASIAGTVAFSVAFAVAAGFLRRAAA